MYKDFLQFVQIYFFMQTVILLNERLFCEPIYYTSYTLYVKPSSYVLKGFKNVAKT